MNIRRMYVDGQGRRQLDRRLALGRIVQTSGSLDKLNPEDVLAALARHVQCDWGELCDHDWQVNDEAVEEGNRVLSCYHDRAGTRFWIITEWDRSATTVLLPDEY